MTAVVRLSFLILLVSVTACSGATPEQAATPAASVEAGQLLFRNKGCVTCHRNARVEGETGLLAVGPDLTTYRGDPEYLRQWLDDPRAFKPDTAMPDLGLTTAEIEDLIAFLNAPR